ncbi:hypothetical protein [Streptomyces sp. NPDC001781]
MDANALREKARRSEQTARERIGRLSDDNLAVQWLLTETQPMSAELAVVRGWIMDELEKRMTPDQFDAWLFTDGDAVDPTPFFRAGE